MKEASLTGQNGLFARVFPPPKFLEMRGVGLSFSDEGIAALEFISRNGARVIGRYGRKELASGAITSGTINDTEQVESLVRSLRDELRLDFVRVSFSEEKAYLYQTHLPSMTPEESRAALELSLEEFVPLSVSEAVFDYALLQHRDGESDVAVAAVPRAVADAYLSVVRSAGLVPLSLCLEAEAIARAVVSDEMREPALILQLGAAKTGLFIVADRAVQFTSTVSVGCVPQSIAPGATGNPFLACANAVSVLKDEVAKIVAYWRTHGSNKDRETPRAPEKIILSGRPAGTAGFASYLAAAFSLPVEVGNVWQNAFSFDDCLPSIPLSESFAFAAAAGLALGERY